MLMQCLSSMMITMKKMMYMMLSMPMGMLTRMLMQ